MRAEHGFLLLANEHVKVNIYGQYGKWYSVKMYDTKLFGRLQSCECDLYHESSPSILHVSFSVDIAITNKNLIFTLYSTLLLIL